MSGIRSEAAALLTCDPPMKQFLLYTNEKEKPQFIVAELDATHLLILESEVERVKARVARYIEEQNAELESKRVKKN